MAPNHQVYRNTPLHTRANVAYFGTFGYELDLNKLSDREQEQVKEQIRFMKKYREVLQFGDFYRLKSPFDGNVTAWMVVNEERTLALVGWYRVLCGVNMPFTRIKLQGLKDEYRYEIAGREGWYFGNELMNLGLITTDYASGEGAEGELYKGDFDSGIFVLAAKGMEQ